MPNANTEGEYSKITKYEPNHIEIVTELKSPGLVVLADVFYAGWQLEVQSEDQTETTAKILRTNRQMRGVLLAAGKHRLIYRYQPSMFYWGAGVSILALFVIAAWLFIRVERRNEIRNSLRGMLDRSTSSSSHAFRSQIC